MQQPGTAQPTVPQVPHVPRAPEPLQLQQGDTWQPTSATSLPQAELFSRGAVCIQAQGTSVLTISCLFKLSIRPWKSLKKRNPSSFSLSSRRTEASRNQG